MSLNSAITTEKSSMKAVAKAMGRVMVTPAAAAAADSAPKSRCPVAAAGAPATAAAEAMEATPAGPARASCMWKKKPSCTRMALQAAHRVNGRWCGEGKRAESGAEAVWRDEARHVGCCVLWLAVQHVQCKLPALPRLT
jgi:hypothetical protein